MNIHLSPTVRDILDGIRAQPGRVGLSCLAIAVGMIALTVLLAVLGGLQDRARRLIQDLGVNVAALVQKEPGDNAESRQRLKQSHQVYLEANLSGCVVSGFQKYNNVNSISCPTPLTVIATDDRLFRIRQWPLVAGRLFDARDVQDRQYHAIISRSLSEKYNWNPSQIITLESMPFQIVGVVDMASHATEEDAMKSPLAFNDQAVFVPGTVLPYWIGMEGSPEPLLDAILIQVPEASAFAETVKRAQRLLSQPDQQVSGLSWITPDLIIQRIKRLQDTIKVTVGSIALLCLILGGTTLMSLMVANVRDRVTEIGLRRSLGATPRDIAQLFVLEACLVTAVSALGGTLATHLLLWLAGHRLPVPLALGATSLFVPLLVAIALGVAFSYWPAKSAARIAPSEALRND